MRKPTMFIACSGRTLELAKQLRASLNEDYCIADVWHEVSQREVGKSILSMLTSAAKKYDFALVILAKDDVLVSKAGEELKARDNCVFEAGLFIGVIGEERCFLLSSVLPTALPSDLGGIIYLPFTEPSDLQDPDACRRAVVSVCTRVESLVRNIGPITNRPLSEKELLERARRTFEGGELLMDQVVVAAVQPLDVDYVAARQIRKNIDAGNIRYVYFLPGNRNGAMKTCELLQTVLLADMLANEAEANDWRGRLDRIAGNKEIILGVLERICNEERIKVFFLPVPPALQYCIHNARNDKNAKLYLKHRIKGELQDEYIEWASGKEAYDFWNTVEQAQGANEYEPPKAVFYGAIGFNLVENDAFLPSLRQEVRNMFPGIEEDVLRLCLEGPKMRA